MKGVTFMTWRQIESRRETRLWISQIIMPAIIAAGTILAIPESRNAIILKAKDIKQSIKNKFKKD